MGGAQNGLGGAPMSATGAERVTTTHVELGTAARPVLVRWCTWRVGGGATFDSYALLTQEGPVLVEPGLPAPAADTALWDLLGALPVATLVTNDWHERGCYTLRERWGRGPAGEPPPRAQRGR